MTDHSIGSNPETGKLTVVIFSGSLSSMVPGAGSLEIRNSERGFDLELVGSEWLLDLARKQSVHQRASAEFVFEVPVRRPDSGELNFVFSTFPLDPADGVKSERVVLPR